MELNGHNHNINGTPRNREYSPVAIANYFVKKAALDGKKLDILQLVKLAYLAHGWCMGFTGKPLFADGAVEAWKYGPVIPEVYRAFRPQGVVISGRAMDENGAPIEAKLDQDLQHVVDDVYNSYARLSSFGLTHLTHKPGTPWDEYKDCYYAPIPNDKIRAYYKNRVAEGPHER